MKTMKVSELIKKLSALDPEATVLLYIDDVEEGGVAIDGRAINWEQSFNRRGFLNINGGLPPMVRFNKTKILTWMIYWPWSAIWTVINDPIKRIFKFIYNVVQDYLQSISNRIFRHVQ